MIDSTVDNLSKRAVRLDSLVYGTPFYFAAPNTFPGVVMVYMGTVKKDYHIIFNTSQEETDWEQGYIKVDPIFDKVVTVKFSAGEK